MPACGRGSGNELDGTARCTCRRANEERRALGSRRRRRGSEITCVTEAEQPQSATPTTACKDGEQRGGLLEWRKLDPLERLKEFRGFPRSGPKLKTSYTHDAFDRVSWQNEWPNGQTQARRTDFAHLGLGPQVVSEKQSGAQTTSKSYSLDPDGEAIGMSSGTTSYSFARNANDSVSLLLKETGGAQASYGYKPYGDLDGPLSGEAGNANLEEMKSKPLNAYRFQGFRFDSGSKDLDMGARRFSPSVGRFLQQDFYRGALSDLDLSLDPLTQNRYAFAGGNPVSFVEVDGHQAVAVNARQTLALNNFLGIWENAHGACPPAAQTYQAVTRCSGAISRSSAAVGRLSPAYGAGFSWRSLLADVSGVTDFVNCTKDPAARASGAPPPPCRLAASQKQESC